jgi:putative ABC transport system permease protein
VYALRAAWGCATNARRLVEGAILFLALRNLVSEKTRFAFSAAGIGFAVFLMTILLGLYQGWNNKIAGFVEDVDADAWIARQGATDFINAASILPDDRAEEFEEERDVARAFPLIVRPMVFYNGEKETVMHLVGYVTGDGGDAAGGPVDCAKGDCTPEGKQIVVDEVLARTRGVEIGDVLRSGDTQIEVIGYSSGGNFAFTTAGFMDIEEVQDFLDMDGLATFILVRMEPGVDVEAWLASVEAEDPAVAAFTNEQFADSTRERILGDVIPIILLIVGLAFIVGIAITSLTIYTTTVEKSREFGVMKAIGFNNLDLFKLVVVQSLLIGLLGFAFGATLTFILSKFIDQIVPQFIVLMRVLDIGFVLLATLAMAALAAIVPARRVGSLDPAVVFRG